MCPYSLPPAVCRVAGVSRKVSSSRPAPGLGAELCPPQLRDVAQGTPGEMAERGRARSRADGQAVRGGPPQGPGACSSACLAVCPAGWPCSLCALSPWCGLSISRSSGQQHLEKPLHPGGKQAGVLGVGTQQPRGEQVSFLSVLGQIGGLSCISCCESDQRADDGTILRAGPRPNSEGGPESGYSEQQCLAGFSEIESGFSGEYSRRHLGHECVCQEHRTVVRLSCSTT